MKKSNETFPVNAPSEIAVSGPEENFEFLVCGIDGCNSKYADVDVMARHKLRMHNIGVKEMRTRFDRHGNERLA